MNTDYQLGQIPVGWRTAIGASASSDALGSIHEAILRKNDSRRILPSSDLVFAALDATPFENVRAVILGQDPYPTRGYAMGLAFSVPNGVRPLPQSLQNIREELVADCPQDLPEGGSLEAWTRHGVLLLNTVLTVAEGAPGSQRGCGWEQLTGAVIRAIAGKEQPIAFLLWGKQAQAAANRQGIDKVRHVVVRSAHPSPLSARHGFFGSRPFSRANAGLESRGALPIDWTLWDPSR